MLRTPAAMNIIATRKAEQNRAAADPWTVIHFAAGLALGLMDVPLRWALAASAGYEVVEQVAERKEWGKSFFRTSGPESLPNAAVDMVILVAGHRLGRAWNATDPARGAS